MDKVEETTLDTFAEIVAGNVEDNWASIEEFDTFQQNDAKGPNLFVYDDSSTVLKELSKKSVNNVHYFLPRFQNLLYRNIDKAALGAQIDSVLQELIDKAKNKGFTWSDQSVSFLREYLVDVLDLGSRYPQSGLFRSREWSQLGNRYQKNIDALILPTEEKKSLQFIHQIISNADVLEGSLLAQGSQNNQLLVGQRSRRATPLERFFGFITGAAVGIVGGFLSGGGPIGALVGGISGALSGAATLHAVYRFPPIFS